MSTEDPSYPPLNTLKAIADDVWIVDAPPIEALGLPLPIRMAVVRLSSGELLLYSPTPWSADLAASLEAIGPIKHLVSPNIGHWMFLKAWQDHYPGAITWAAPGLRGRSQVRRAGVRIDRELERRAPPDWSADIDLVATPGAGFVEFALFHRRSRTLLMADLVQRLEAEALPPLKAEAAKALGLTSPKGAPPVYLRAALLARRGEARAAVARLIALEPERVVFAHGRWFDRDGAHQLRAALGSLLGTKRRRSLEAQVVVITGASSGIGRAAALAFAREGASVVLAARRAEVLEEVARECRAVGGEALAVPTDVTRPDGVQRLAEAAAARFGHIDIWINNAGVGVFGRFDQADITLHRRTVEVNLLGTMHGAWAILPAFLRQGHGTLINNISLGGWAPTPFAAAYTASKFGLRGFTASLRQELADHPEIHVCAVFPSMVDTPGFEHGANMSGRNLDPGPLLYRAEDVARTFVRLAHAPRAEVAVGWPARLGQVSYALAPSLTERSTGAAFRALLSRAGPAPRTPGALLASTPEGVETSGQWLTRKKLPSASTLTAGIGAVGLLGLALLATAKAAQRRRRIATT